MKTVKHIQTIDGKLHNDYQDAKRHAEKEFGFQVSKLAHKLLSPELCKYKDMQEFLASDSFIMSVRNMGLLKADITMEETED